MASTATETKLHSLIANRWSPRAFTAEKIEENKLQTLFEAARRAPSNMNLQPWRFVYASREQPEAFNNILEVLMEKNQRWAKNASVLIAAVAEAVNPKTGSRNPYAWHDVGLAVENLVLQGESLGIKAHQMAGFDAQKARQVIRIPENFEPVSIIALGYPGEAEQLPEEFREKERQASSRKALEEMVFRDRF